MKELIKKLINKETITYIIFGVGSTVVNLAVFKLFDLIFTAVTDTDLVLLTNLIAWVAAVVFAFVTNKIWVFESKSIKPAVLTKEISSFFACRLLTGFLDVGIMWLGVDLLHFNSTLLKIVANIVVIVLNYVASKLFIFKSKK